MSGFNLPAHHNFVQRKGERILWSRANLCPCGNTPDGNRSRVTCMHCGGLGLRYEDPIEIVGIVTGVTREKTLLEAGVVDVGDLLLGLSPFEHSILSDWDMIELQWQQGQPFQGELIKRGLSGPSDILDYPPKHIFSCESIEPNTQVLTTYTEGINFSVSGVTLTWVDGQPQPAPGQVYNIKYTAIFQWVCFVSPFDRFEQDRSLGQKCLLRKRSAVMKKVTA